jgi:hypothetical protein
MPTHKPAGNHSESLVQERALPAGGRAKLALKLPKEGARTAFRSDRGDRI